MIGCLFQILQIFFADYRCCQLDNSFSRIANPSLELDNPFSRIAIRSLELQFVLSNWTTRSLGLQFVPSNCTIVIEGRII